MHDWPGSQLPYPPEPTPPAHVNGWGRYVAAQLASLAALLHSVQHDHTEMRSDHQTLLNHLHELTRDHHETRERLVAVEVRKPPPPPPTGDLWTEINSGLRTLAAVGLLAAYLLGKIDKATLDAIKAIASGGH